MAAAVGVLDYSREYAATRMLRAWAVAGLFYMLLPGTFLGVANLISISARHGAGAISAAWVQAHGHAQIFGWIGSFILGISFYSLPRSVLPTMRRVWIAWALWTGGVLLRWTVAVYAWHWRIGLPISAAMELLAWLISFTAARRHGAVRRKAAGSTAPHTAAPAWMMVVSAGSLGFGTVLAANFIACVWCALSGSGPAFPHLFDQRFLVLVCWGFLVPFVWGFSARWLPIFLGLGAVRRGWLLAAVVVIWCGIACAGVGQMTLSSLLLLNGCVFAVTGLGVFEASERGAKTEGVHVSFPVFLRLAYVWLLIAAMLGVWAARADLSGGIWGASRHAFTVGFIATMVFCVGQRILPHFAGRKKLFSVGLMFASLLLLNLGCALRVIAEPIAYEGLPAASSMWGLLPYSAVIEMAAVTIFAVNLLCTFRLSPPIVAARG